MKLIHISVAPNLGASMAFNVPEGYYPFSKHASLGEDGNIHLLFWDVEPTTKEKKDA